MVMATYDVLKLPLLLLTWDTETERGTLEGRLSWRGAEGARDMGWTDGVTSDGCTWLIWGREGPHRLPSPIHVCLGNVTEMLGWKMLENMKISKVGMTDISEMHSKCSISAGDAKSLG